MWPFPKDAVSPIAVWAELLEGWVDVVKVVEVAQLSNQFHFLYRVSLHLLNYCQHIFEPNEGVQFGL